VRTQVEQGLLNHALAKIGGEGTLVEADIKDFQAQKLAILGLLGDLEWHPSAELMDVSSHRYSARVWDLKQDGHIITSRRVQGRRMWEYKLSEEAKSSDL